LASVAAERTSAELYDVLIANARPAPYATPDASGHDPVYGYGIIDPVASLEQVMSGAGGGGGAGGAGAVSGAGGAIHPAQGEPSEAADDSGCGCRTAGGASPHLGLLVGLAAAGAIARRRRQRIAGGARLRTTATTRSPAKGTRTLLGEFARSAPMPS